MHWEEAREIIKKKLEALLKNLKNVWEEFRKVCDSMDLTVDDIFANQSFPLVKYIRRYRDDEKIRFFYSILTKEIKGPFFDKTYQVNYLLLSEKDEKEINDKDKFLVTDFREANVIWMLIGCEETWNCDYISSNGIEIVWNKQLGESLERIINSHNLFLVEAIIEGGMKVKEILNKLIEMLREMKNQHLKENIHLVKEWAADIVLDSNLSSCNVSSKKTQMKCG